jgi:hypothetical protein
MLRKSFFMLKIFSVGNKSVSRKTSAKVQQYAFTSLLMKTECRISPTKSTTTAKITMLIIMIAKRFICWIKFPTVDSYGGFIRILSLGILVAP